MQVLYFRKIALAQNLVLITILWLTGQWWAGQWTASVGQQLSAQEYSSSVQGTTVTANTESVIESELGRSNDRDIKALVELLQDSRFEVRERASVELLSIGSGAIDALNEIPSGWSRDARRHAACLVAEIENRVLTRASREFLFDPDPTQSHGLPAWDIFRGIVGNSRCSKLLFLEMVKTEHAMLKQIETLQQQRFAGSDTSLSLQVLTDQARHLSTVMNPRVFRGLNTGVGESTAVLLATTMLESTAPIEANQLVYSAVQLSFFGYLSKPGYRQCLQKLLALWVPKTHDEMAPEIMRIAFELDLPTVLPIARRHLMPVFDRYSRENAIFCIGKFGDVSDVAELIKMTSDTTVVHEFNESAQGFDESLAVPPGLPGTNVVDSVRKIVRINDMAAAAAMVLLKQDVKQCFPRFTRENFFSRSVASLAVLEEESELRTEAIKAWAQAQLARTLEG